MKTKNVSIMWAFLAIVATSISISKGQLVLLQDEFNGSAGTVPNAAEFDWSGQVDQNGSGELHLQTWNTEESWLKSKDTATPSAFDSVVLRFRAYAYAEGNGSGIVYANLQPRGLRVGTDPNNVIEFYSDQRNVLGMRTRSEGVETVVTYPVSTVYEMIDYEISVTRGSAVFKVNGIVAATINTNVPDGALNAYFATSRPWPSNIPIAIDRMSMQVISSHVFRDGFEAAEIDPFWTKRNQNTATSLQTEVLHSGMQAVQFSTTTPGQKEAQLEHVFPVKQYGKASVWVYDPMEYIYFSLTLRDSTSTESWGVGVQDWDYSAYYCIDGKTSFARTAGWHQFTVEMRESSTRCMIDGTVVYAAQGGNQFDKVVLSMSGPGTTGTVYFDDFIFESTIAPEISVQQPAGRNMLDGGKKNFGTVTIGKSSWIKTFTIKNTGNDYLKNMAIVKSGPHAKDFIVTVPHKYELRPGGSTTFMVWFTPRAFGNRYASIHIFSDDVDESPFDIKLVGQGNRR